ncbi:MAG: hypothetical protein LBU34_04480 [Planctomycetaceae bacterium]|jgi:hypothetical protein|nr:hypothetical protein [Planctomycetaceae bacterium]
MSNSKPTNETLNWIRRVRDESYEAMKGMSPQERIEYRQSQRKKQREEMIQDFRCIEADLTDEERALIEESVKRYHTDPSGFVPLENIT